ncbi:MAG: UDP-N-acetylmuramoyl-tripeptide--D-alanyl-D-alanine ligase [Flavobacteriaceae bacterium]|jgi:UDP-N-acetylmuramoyl-tripeptide--D-alanyl-D-alanine ligase|nr:UDP-N-acetylmuramoyl-tripeptide--D-alanyl-D-alanine ligase [Flavobacteriaceae bacterium]
MTIEELYSLYLQAEKINTDTRTIVKGDLFFALKGEHFNGNEFAEQAVKNGALAAIVDEKEFENPEKGIFWVENTLFALQNLARYHRQKLSIPVIALTGSNGKTTSKELMSSVLKQKFNVLYTQGNFNNHIGVPLTLLSIKPEHEIAIVEMGANHQKEIELLTGIAQPNIGYITNFGKAHLEGFGGAEGVIKGKSELYTYLRKFHQSALVNEDDSKQIELTHDIQTISFGTKSGMYQFSLAENENNRVNFTFGNVLIHSQLTGNYNFANLCAASALGFHFGLTVEQIKQGIESYEPHNQRSQIVKKENKTLVLDTYNANPSSMEASLSNFADFQGSKTVILGDMFELGEESLGEHQKIADLAENLHFDFIYLLGERFYQTENHADNIQKFCTTDEMKKYLQEYKIQTNNVLMKGSRGMALEKLFEAL